MRVIQLILIVLLKDLHLLLHTLRVVHSWAKFTGAQEVCFRFPAATVVCLKEIQEKEAVSMSSNIRHDWAGKEQGATHLLCSKHKVPCQLQRCCRKKNGKNVKDCCLISFLFCVQMCICRSASTPNTSVFLRRRRGRWRRRLRGGGQRQLRRDRRWKTLWTGRTDPSSASALEAPLWRSVHSFYAPISALCQSSFICQVTVC